MSLLPPAPPSSDEIAERWEKALNSHGDPMWDEVVAAMLRASCAYVASEFLSGPDEAPYFGKFVIEAHHLEWDKIVTSHDRFCVEAPRGHGKCAVRGSLVLSTDGRRVPIEEWQGGQVWAYNPAHGGFEKAHASAMQPNGQRECVRIRTKTGRIETVTTNHPLRVSTHEWVQAARLMPGLRIAVASDGWLQSQGITAHAQTGCAKSDGSIYWDELVEVTPVGEQETFGIHVPGLENYIGQDVVNHNTYFFTLAYPLWKVMCQADGLGYVFSETADQAILILEEIKREIEGNPKLQYLYPAKVGRKWSATEIELSNGHRVRARGYGTRVRGGHPDWIMNDDVVSDTAAYSKAVRDKQINFFYSAITGMILRSGQIGLVGTPQHNQDLYGDLEKNSEYHFQRFPAVSKGKALWPDHYSMERLDRIKSEIGTVRFAREYGCVPVADDMSLFPKKLFFEEPMMQPAVTLGLPLSYWRTMGVTKMYIGVDFAMSSNVSADYTVIWVMGTDAHKNRWLIDIVHQRGLPYQQQLALINDYGRKYEALLMYLESNQMQRIFSQELQRTTDLPIKAYNTGAEKHALDEGLPSLRILLENKKYRIPRGDARSVELTDAWIEEMHNFTFHQGKMQSVGGHDDLVMANWLCELAVRAGGFSFSFGEDVPLEGAPTAADLSGFDPNGGQVVPFGPRVAANGAPAHTQQGWPDDATAILRRGY